jgi:ATP/maltotriose-dependent transcriptional regulator MalT
MLAHALTMLASGELVEGHAASARTHAAEGLSLARATGQPNIACFHLTILARTAASFGTAEEARTLAAESQELAIDRRLAMFDHHASIALAELELANARPEHALRHLNPVLEHGTGVGTPLMRHHAILTFVETAARVGRNDEATEALDGFEQWFSATGSAPNLALLARGRALLAGDEGARDHFEAALRLHASAARPYDRARTRLLYGEWLRRHRQRLAAREHLRVALDLFERLAAQPWVERARSELRASGETARRAGPTSPEHLTPQELQVARLVAAGATSKEAAGRLFLSPRTIDAHLRSIFAKLGVASRSALRDIDLGDTDEKTEPPMQGSPG